MPSRAKRTGFAPAPLVVTLAPITSIQVPTWEASLGGMDVRVATHNLRPVAPWVANHVGWMVTESRGICLPNDP